MNNFKETFSQLEKITELDLKKLSSEEIKLLKTKIGKTAQEFYTIANIELRKREK